MALILLVNLAFSMVGFFFIVRMWREVRDRRDEYGENFLIPRGKNRTEKERRKASKLRREEADEIEYMEYDEESEYGEEEGTITQDDMQKMLAQIIKAQKGAA